MKRAPAARRTKATLELSPDAAPLGGVEVAAEADVVVLRVMTAEVVRTPAKREVSKIDDLSSIGCIILEVPLDSVTTDVRDSVEVMDVKEAELVTDPVWLAVPVED